MEVLVKRMLLAAAIAASAGLAAPSLAQMAATGETRLAQAEPAAPGQASGAQAGGAQAGGAPGGVEPGMGQRGNWGMRGGPMMRHRMWGRAMMRGNPQERCVDRLAWRAARRAYVETKLDLTAEQRPLWDKLQAIAEAQQQKERPLCATLKEDGSATMLDRIDRAQQFLSSRLDALRAAKPAVQALYQALSPDQREIFDHPFRP